MLKRKMCIRDRVNADDAVTDFPPFKHFLFLYKHLSDKLTQFEAEKAQATRSQQILAKAKEYGCLLYTSRCV